MTRNELKEIIVRILDEVEKETPETACIFFDAPCDVSTEYSVGEEG